MRHNKLFIVLALLFMCACSGKDYNLYEYASTHLIDEYVEATTFKLDKIDDNLLIMKPADNAKSYVSQELAKAGYGSQAGVSKFNAMAAQNGDEGFEWNIMYDSNGKYFHYSALTESMPTIELTCSTDFDASHPAGTSLMDVVKVQIYSFAQFLGDNRDEIFYFEISDKVRITKRYADFTEEEKAIVGSTFYLVFEKTPAVAGNYEFTVTTAGKYKSEPLKVHFAE